jgi:AraC-like DNA-binding protein
LWIVDSDPSYIVKPYNLKNTNYIALRTIRGKGLLIIDDNNQIEVTPGTLYIFKHSQIKYYGCMADEWYFRWYDFSLSDVSFPDINVLHSIDETENELSLSLECIKLQKSGNNEASIMSSAIFSFLLSGWIYRLNSNRFYSKDSININSVLEYIESKISNQLTVSELARHVNICPRRFHDIFKAETGFTPKQYIHRHRLLRAKELLTCTPFSIALIAEQLGFANQFHFSNFFKKKYGLSPKEYRNSRESSSEK